MSLILFVIAAFCGVIITGISVAIVVVRSGERLPDTVFYGLRFVIQSSCLLLLILLLLYYYLFPTCA
jgi:hypothetical protein